MFFRLHNHCTLVTGKARGAIYDFSSNKVYSISAKAIELLTLLTIKPCEEVYTSADTKAVEYLQRLTELGLGQLYDNDPGLNDYKIPSKPDAVLDFLWLELTNACNNRCLHCYSDSSPTSHTGSVSHERWLTLLEEAKNYGASAVQLIGGEPLLYARWRELVTKAHDLGFSFIEIFTNAVLLKEDDILFLKQNNVSVATTIYADNSDVHDKVTQNAGSFEKTLAAIKCLLANDVPLRIASVIMKTNEDEVENIMKLQETLGLEPSPPDIVRPTGRGDDRHILPEKYSKPPITPPFYADEEYFVLSHFYNTCLAGKLAVTAQGEVIPCIFARDLICGNINEQSLENIIRQKLKEYWTITKDKLTKCRDCEYRYACSDCRPISISTCSKRDLYAPTAECSYDPCTGKWK